MNDIKALVLLGQHGVGKDTMATLLQNTHESVGNIKFSSLSKHIVASALDIPYAVMEDRLQRNTLSATSTFGFSSDLTPLDLLNVLYHGMNSNTSSGKAMVEAGIQYAMKAAYCFTLPVFTDVRRLQEMQAVQQQYGKDLVVIRLYKSYTEEEQTEEGDELLNEVINYCIWNDLNLKHIERKYGDSPLETFNSLIYTLKTNRS